MTTDHVGRARSGMLAPPRRSAVVVLPFAASLLLSGCSWFGWLHPSFSYLRMPVPKAASQPGATQQSVVHAGGNPTSVWMVRNGTGVCYNYLLKHAGEHRPYYVVFDHHGKVMRHGFATCMDADHEGALR